MSPILLMLLVLCGHTLRSALAKCTYQFIVNEMDPESCPCLIQRPELMTLPTPSTTRYATTVSPTTDDQLDNYQQDLQSNDVLDMDTEVTITNNSKEVRKKEKSRQDTHNEDDVTPSTRRMMLKELEFELKLFTKEYNQKLKDLELLLAKEIIASSDMRNSWLRLTQKSDESCQQLNASLQVTRSQFKIMQSEMDKFRDTDEMTSRLDKMEVALDEHRKLLGILDGGDRHGKIHAKVGYESRLLWSLDKIEDEKVIGVKAAAETMCHGISKNGTSYKDCHEVWERGHEVSGVYYIKPIYTPCPIPVYCDMSSNGGWLIIQRRSNGQISFNRNWTDYQRGFGNINGDYWLGNDNIFLLTNQESYSLRIDMWDFNNTHAYAEYLYFSIGGERDRYRLLIMNYTGNIKDGLVRHHGALFSTPDNDNDSWPEYHCAQEWQAGWWFNNCWFVILNGPYYNSSAPKYRGISWNDWKTEQLKRVEMKIKPSPYM